LKNGEIRDQETEWGSIVPNSDGTYSTWAFIRALPTEKDKYQCRVEHASLPEPGLYQLETESKLLAILGWVLGPIAIGLVAIVIGVFIWK
ncbi:HA1F protein, partial [Galbula dea]|nr:HA1F protein [Galbula dea]